ncbi:putative bifunctional diguanylate cyclase/phosphodiesterase [Novacetimonas pomaceti]|uniref:putative bifunctional diguanylate cyclase/phosphodiesterase n=1 Tax=Novacetimonas pomaceti TaxID=2021998 RepID=UPI001C2D8CF9|nr:bifunctional diguanylate cyclase/phosphodiesterase [Novacetimonas pomaceti]MBV1835327.1 bifunctional diguanylate cyclase/phosphodiesterase [Novacetimonas pomaceti]
MSLQHDDRLRALTRQDADFWADLVDDVLIVAITDLDGVITYVNEKFCKVSKYSAEELLGSTHRILNSGYHDAAFFQDMYRTIKAGQPWRGNICNRAKDGTIYWVATTIIPHVGPDGTVEGYVASRFEITELMKTKERLSEMAETDTLTALLNRGGFNTALTAALGLSSKEPPQSRALVMFDLDGFKQINDIHGHHAGDIVLRVVASRLVELTDPDDPISRLGGDEFAIVLNKTLRSMPLEKYMDRLQAALERPIDIETVTVSIAGSIGAVFLDARESVEDMQKNADMALYAGGKQAQMFTDALRQRAKVRSQILIEARSGVKDGQFEVYYQPILNCHTSQLDQIEALLRWHHPERGLLAAEDFADVFTDSTLTQAMGPSMIASFQRDIALWERTGQPPRQLAINMSRMDLGRTEYRVELERSLREFGLSPSDFVLEVTEQMLQGRRAGRSMRNIRELSEAGFQIAMDNFGKGETTLRHLHDLPFNQLKIDQSLVAGIVDNPGECEVLASLVSLGQVYGLEVTVEGVETRAQFDLVLAMKPDRVQGFFISPALSSSALTKLPPRFEIAA